MTAPLRIVFDTNVYISAALFGRLTERVLELASAGQVTLITSEPILTELHEKLTGKLAWPSNRAQLFIETIRDLAEVVEPEIVLSVVPDDDDDNRIIECAVEGKAALIVTFDKDLLRLKSYDMIGIITPKQLTYYGLEE
ncbi:MAG: putative toxin-antitoxin system toxin component, PIN family [Aliifodinibius sp.]|nr:putative toxin-antitoxin system toxin component, PIN family [Phycisphaerae bacterium]NIT59487.1 putative toxin-antitoxin system toxin component, PIN family [Fodinibius sp.]NIW46987.1 putative toxin-antitoxin system toxin component, PIN family [Gammaproteobacteria bacterium]NIY28070.1 putative toxin-antitoxin system toxin component, PIN family [Fodinibius sp.]